MKQLYLMRHAKSEWDDPDLDDHDRPLSPRGERAAPLMAGHLKSRSIQPGLILCSTARRTRETLGFLTPALDGVPVQFERQVYTFNPDSLFDRLRLLDDSLKAVMVVGHNPALQDLILMLTEGQTVTAARTALEDKFPTAAYAELDLDIGSWRDLATGCGRLAHFTRPRDLA